MSLSTLIMKIPRFSFLIVMLLGWEVAQRFGYLGLFAAHLLPPPSQIVLSFYRLAIDGTFIQHAPHSLRRVFFAFIIAMALAIPMGLILGWNRIVYRLFEPLIEVLRPIPATALLGFSLLMFGIGDNSRIFVALYGSFFVLLIATLYGVYSVDETLVLSMRSLKMKESALFWNVVLPSALPYISGGLRQALAVSLILVTAVEMVFSNNGLGHLIIFSEMSFRVEEMYAVIFLLGGLGYGLTKLLLVLEARMIGWRTAQRESLEA